MADNKHTWQNLKKIKERNARAKMRERIIYERYFINGEKLELIAKELGYKSLSAIEKAVARVRKEHNLPVKRKMTGEAMDEVLVGFLKGDRSKTKIFFTVKQLKEEDFKHSNVLHAFKNCTFTRRGKEKWFFVLAKDYKCTGEEDTNVRRKIAKQKTSFYFQSTKK